MTKTQAIAETRLQGRWLTLARAAWLVAFIFYGGLSIAALPSYFPGIQAQGIPPALIPVGWSAEETRAELVKLGWSVEVYVNIYAVSALVVSGLSLALGVLIFWRKTTNCMAWIASLALIGSAAVTFTAVLKQALPLNWKGLSDLVVTVPSGILFLLLLLLFPNGQFVPHWTRWIVVAFIGVLAISLFFPSSPWAASGFIGSLVVGVGAVVGVIGAQIYRYRQVSTAAERQQTRWVVFGLSLFLLLSLVQSLLAAVLPGLMKPSMAGLLVRGFGAQIWGGIFSALIPLSFAIAILRHRLWDIDLIIRRTLQYSVLSSLLTLVYFGLITLLQRLFFANQQSEISIVLSTLAIAALFFPLRNRVQEFIDKRFYRKKYDAQKVLAEFAATCRDETDLDKLTARLAEVIDETLQPETVSVWIKDSNAKPQRREDAKF